MDNNITPLFKWAGGKQRMFAPYEEHFENLKPSVFVDMFGGSSTMSMWIHKNFPDKKIVLNEFNECIVGVYNALKNDFVSFKNICLGLEEEYLSYPRGKTPAAVAKKESPISSRSGLYFKIRDDYNKKYLEGGADYANSTEGAAKMYFLLKTCFNGIWQGSSTTPYSTPHGNGNESKVFDMGVVEEYANMFKDAEIFCGSFENIKEYEDAFYYADPPYLASKTEYSREGFGIKETQQLCDLLSEKEFFAMSNKDHPLLRENLSGVATFHTFAVKYTATRKDTEASSATEILIIKH